MYRWKYNPKNRVQMQVNPIDWVQIILNSIEWEQIKVQPKRLSMNESKPIGEHKWTSIQKNVYKWKYTKKTKKNP